MYDSKTEMSTIDDLIPRYYKGYDMDLLLHKLYNEQPITEEEKHIVDEAQDIYYKDLLYGDADRRQEYMQTHPGKFFRTITKHTKDPIED